MELEIQMNLGVNMIQISEKQLIPKMKLLRGLVKGLYSRTTGVFFKRGNFRVKGDIVDVFPVTLM